VTTLAELSVGDSGTVKTVTGSDPLSLRILEMGLTPGTGFRYIGQAPLGDPIEIDVRGYRLSLRRIEAARIQVAIRDEP
jgi:ferrous iron transport protein A